MKILISGLEDSGQKQLTLRMSESGIKVAGFLAKLQFNGFFMAPSGGLT